MRVYISFLLLFVNLTDLLFFSVSDLVPSLPLLKLGSVTRRTARGTFSRRAPLRMPCQRADALRLGVPQELCGAELQPMLMQLGRDMQYWKPRSITPAMLDEIREAKRDDPVRVALMIVNRTVWYLRPLGTQRSPMVIALVHDLQACASPPLHLRTPARLPNVCTLARLPRPCTPARLHPMRRS